MNNHHESLYQYCTRCELDSIENDYIECPNCGESVTLKPTGSAPTKGDLASRGFADPRGN